MTNHGRECIDRRAHRRERRAADEVYGLSATQITTLALVVNELMTNAIKHAFEEGKSGHIRVSIIGQKSGCDAVILVDDDGLPFLRRPAAASAWGSRSG